MLLNLDDGFLGGGAWKRGVARGIILCRCVAMLLLLLSHRNGEFVGVAFFDVQVSHDLCCSRDILHARSCQLLHPGSRQYWSV